jgi:transglutaminase-like putative cysteine protease
MIYDVHHITEIGYAAPIRLARFNLRLQPAPWPTQAVSDYRLRVDPAPATIATEEGPYVVNVSRLTLNEPIDRLVIESRFSVAVMPPARPAPETSPSIRALRAEAASRRDLSKTGPAPYLYASRIALMEPEITRWAAPFLGDDDRPAALAAADLMRAIFRAFDYDSDATEAETAPVDAFRQRRGVCQDFAHIMIIALRAYGLPAAYVSGYLRTLPPPGEPRLIGADATHAWVNLWCGADAGWLGFDPTNDQAVESDHIFTAMGRDYADVAPVDGVFYGGAGQEMRVSVDVAPRPEPPETPGPAIG